MRAGMVNVLTLRALWELASTFDVWGYWDQSWKKSPILKRIRVKINNNGRILEWQ